jgi:hypothetical protein
VRTRVCCDTSPKNPHMDLDLPVCTKREESQATNGGEQANGNTKRGTDNSQVTRDGIVFEFDKELWGIKVCGSKTATTTITIQE